MSPSLLDTTDRNSLTTLLDMVDSTRKWPIAQIKIPETWSSGGAKLVLLGDAAHAMLPNMALGETGDLQRLNTYSNAT